MDDKSFPFYFIDKGYGNSGGIGVSDDVEALASQFYNLVLPIALLLLTISLLYDTIRFGIKKEYTANERKGWYWPTLIFKLVLATIIMNFPYLVSIVYAIAKGIKAGFGGYETAQQVGASLRNMNKVYFAFLDKETVGKIADISKIVVPILKDIYWLIYKIGIGLLVIAAVFAATFFGIAKDAQIVRENKQWLIRILGSVVMSGAVLGLVGIFVKIRLS